MFGSTQSYEEIEAERSCNCAGVVQHDRLVTLLTEDCRQISGFAAPA
jgi:hypothetical protein